MDFRVSCVKILVNPYRINCVFALQTPKIHSFKILRPKTSRILSDFRCGGVRKADAYKRRQTEKCLNYAVLGRFGSVVFAYEGEAFRGQYYYCAEDFGLSNRLIAMPLYRNRSFGYQLYKNNVEALQDLRALQLLE